MVINYNGKPEIVNSIDDCIRLLPQEMVEAIGSFMEELYVEAEELQAEILGMEDEVRQGERVIDEQCNCLSEIEESLNRLQYDIKKAKRDRKSVV